MVSFRLTIHAREYALPDSKASAADRLLGINELQHKLLSQAGHCLSGDIETSYPVDVFSRILIETADLHGVTNRLAAAIEYATAKAPRWPLRNV